MVIMKFEIDHDLYEKVTAVLSPQGITLSDAIVLFFQKTVELGQIPFSFTQERLEAARHHSCVRLVSESPRRIHNVPETL